jgi:hypothetical protein
VSVDLKHDDPKGSHSLGSHLLDLSGARLIGNGSLLFAELESSHDSIERRKKIVNGKDHRLGVCALNPPIFHFPNSHLQVTCTPRADSRHDVSSFSALQCRGGPDHDTSICTCPISLSIGCSSRLATIRHRRYLLPSLGVHWLSFFCGPTVPRVP